MSSCTDACELPLLWPQSATGAKVCRMCRTVDVACCCSERPTERRWLLQPPHDSGHIDRTKAPDVPVHSPRLFQSAHRSDESLHSAPLTVVAVATGTARAVATWQTPQLLGQLSVIHDDAALLHWPLAAHVGHVGFVSVQSAVVERPVGQAMPLHRSVVTGFCDVHIDSATGTPFEPVHVTVRLQRPIPHVVEQGPYGPGDQNAMAIDGTTHTTAHRPGIEHEQEDEHCCWIHAAVAPEHSPLLAHVLHCELTSTHADGIGAAVGGMYGTVGALVRGGVTAITGAAVLVEHVAGSRGRHSRIARMMLRLSVGALVGGIVGGSVGGLPNRQQRCGV